MSKEKIISEILESNHKLEKEKVEKIVETLDVINPLENIKIDTFFKQKLQAKIENIWWYEKEVESKFWRIFFWFLSPLFAILFIFTIFSLLPDNIFQKEWNIILSWTWNFSWNILEEKDLDALKTTNSWNMEVSAFSVSTTQVSEENNNTNNSLKNTINTEKNYGINTNFTWNIEKSIKSNSDKNLNLETFDENVIKATTISENYLENEDKIYVRTWKNSSNLPTREISFDLNMADDTEFNRSVLEKRPTDKMPKSIEMKYMDDPNFLLKGSNIRYLPTTYSETIIINNSEKSNNNIEKSIKNQNIISISEFEKECKQNWYVFGKRYSRKFCQFNEKTCFEEDYYKWKCSFLK